MYVYKRPYKLSTWNIPRNCNHRAFADRRRHVLTFSSVASEFSEEAFQFEHAAYTLP